MKGPTAQQELADALEAGFDLLLAMIEGECPWLIEDDLPAFEAIYRVRQARDAIAKAAE